MHDFREVLISGNRFELLSIIVLMYCMTSFILMEAYNDITSKFTVMVFILIKKCLTLSVKSFVHSIAKFETGRIDFKKITNAFLRIMGGSIQLETMGLNGKFTCDLSLSRLTSV